MQTKAFILICTLGAMLCLAACDDDSPTGNGSTTVQVLFPRTVGMLWTYQVYDSLTEETDTMQVSIVDTVTFEPGTLLTIWRSKALDSDDMVEHYVGVRGDTLMILSDTIGDVEVEHFVYPLQADSIWTGYSGLGDTSRVIEVGIFSTPAGTFQSAAHIERSWNLDFEGGGNFTTTWIAPEVGIVFRHFLSRYSDGSTTTTTRNEVWELLEYDLTTFELDQFPIAVGSWWKYAYNEQTRHEGFDDTVIVTVTNQLTLPSGETATLRVYDWQTLERVDTQYIVVADGRIELRQDTAFNIQTDLYYEFPMAVGDHWGIILPKPPSALWIIEKDPVSTPAGDFHSGFRQVTSGDGWLEDEWLVPDVGIVSKERRETSYEHSVVYTWQLLDYHISVGM